MVITANNPSDNDFAGTNSSGTTITIDPGAYSVDETGPGGYDVVFSSECSGTAVAGDTYTCTITNDDEEPPPTTANLTVIKDVVNDNSGTNVSVDFTMVITANNPSDNNFAGSNSSGTTITIDPGAYSIDETGPGGYDVAFSSECSGTAVAGDAYTCTITNDDSAPIICNPPGEGDWTVTQSCTLDSSASIAGSIIVQNGVVLTILDGVTLDIDFANFGLNINFNGGVLIKAGGVIA